MVPLLMTRPLAAAERFVAGLPQGARAGLQVIYAPLMQIRPIQAMVSLDGVKGVIFTSANGVEAASRETAVRLPAFCVGERTAVAAVNAGWQVLSLGQCADELVGRLLQKPPKAPLLHLRGAHVRRGDRHRHACARLHFRLPLRDVPALGQRSLPELSGGQRLCGVGAGAYI